MFSFFKKDNTNTFIQTELLLQTDMHSHVLPGIDDGSPNVETSLELLKGMHDLGIRTVIATPHIIGDLYRNNAGSINKALDEVKKAAADTGLKMEISAAAEYMMDDYFMELLRNNVPLLKVHDNIILTEQSYVSPFDGLKEIAFDLMIKGYKPIMAHPERYFYYHKDYDAYDRLKELGFLLQVNLLSLTGYYGKPVAKAAEFLFKNGLVDLVGTDMHHAKHLEALKQNIPLINQYINGKTFNIFK
jgi:protein-tyrosine phosphatase